MLSRHMTLKDFEIDSFFGDGDRKAFLIYVTEIKIDAARLKAYTDHVLYIDSTIPRL